MVPMFKAVSRAFEKSSTSQLFTAIRRRLVHAICTDMIYSSAMSG